jgi:hypothetical protein
MRDCLGWGIRPVVGHSHELYLICYFDFQRNSVSNQKPILRPVASSPRPLTLIEQFEQHRPPQDQLGQGHGEKIGPLVIEHANLDHNPDRQVRTGKYSNNTMETLKDHYFVKSTRTTP